MTTTQKQGSVGRGLTDANLLIERPHPNAEWGVQRIYRFEGGFGLSLVNSTMLHIFTFAWEAAVLKGVRDDGKFERLIYDTPLTSGVEVFGDDDEANEFIARAAEYFASRATGAK